MRVASPQPSFQSSVFDAFHLERYSQYQKRYVTKIRESDRRLIQLIREHVEPAHRRGKKVRLLDLGCSTGNLLRHLKRALPGLELYGGDIVPSIIEECKRDPALEGIQCDEMDALNLRCDQPFDLIVANAALMFFNEDEFRLAISNIARAIKQEGWCIAFDWFHPFEQELMIVETSKLHPQGLRFYHRSYATVRAALKEVGFSPPTFQPFHIPIDLPRPAIAADITTYTVKTTDGKRLSFRGTLFQPWCYLITQKGR